MCIMLSDYFQPVLSHQAQLDENLAKDVMEKFGSVPQQATCEQCGAPSTLRKSANSGCSSFFC